MNVPLPRAAGLIGAAAVAALTLSACGAAPATTTSGGKNAATATSAADLGGMDALVAAAKKEGTLNAIALPRDWANYGAIIDGFTKKYGIKVNDETPDASSQDELNAITSRKGQDRAPDVVDVGSSFALAGAQQGVFAPYKVAGYDKIPANQKDAQARWYNDYGGYISIGCDAKRVKECPKTFADLLKPQYKNQVALNGNPTKAGAAFGAVYAAALANGGSLDNTQPGIDFFGKVKQAGNFNPVQATPATIYTSRPKATPSTGERDDDTHHRVRYDKIDKAGKITWRYQGQLYSIGIGRTHTRTRVIVLSQDLDIRIIDAATGELLRELILDTSKRYQGTGRPPGPTR